MCEKNKMLKRIIMTCFITLGYSAIWSLLELLIDGQVTNRLVDNIIMTLFIPIIYRATKCIEKS